MAAVGYDLYTQLIESEVQFLKTYADGERPKGYDDPLSGLDPLPSFDVPVRALIPDDYIADQGQRLFFYKELMAARSHDHLQEVAADLEDRYGHPPQEVKNAITVMALRLTARDLHIESVDGNGGRYSVKFKESHPPHPRLPGMVQQKRREVYMAQDRLIWPYASEPLSAGKELLATIQAVGEEIDSDRTFGKH